jgi:hypothetical protein
MQFKGSLEQSANTIGNSNAWSFDIQVPESGISCKSSANHEKSIRLFDVVVSSNTLRHASVLNSREKTYDRSLISFGMDSPKKTTSGLSCRPLAMPINIRIKKSLLLSFGGPPAGKKNSPEQWSYRRTPHPELHHRLDLSSVASPTAQEEWRNLSIGDLLRITILGRCSYRWHVPSCTALSSVVLFRLEVIKTAS